MRKGIHIQSGMPLIHTSAPEGPEHKANPNIGGSNPLPLGSVPLANESSSMAPDRSGVNRLTTGNRVKHKSLGLILLVALLVTTGAWVLKARRQRTLNESCRRSYWKG